MGVFDYLRVRALLMVALVVTAGVATGQPPRQVAAPEQEGPERYARRFTAPEGDWIWESEVPTEPQTAPVDVIWEVSFYPTGSEPTAEQRRAAEDLVERSYQSAEKNSWFDFDKGRTDGYVQMYGNSTHYANEQYVLDDAILDPERPEVLMYYPTTQGTKLVGYMFLVNEPLVRGPQIGGPLTVWHYHILSKVPCFLGGLLIVSEPENGECARGAMLRGRGPEMIHVWLIDHPVGRFASQMSIGRYDLAVALEQRYRERGY